MNAHRALAFLDAIPRLMAAESMQFAAAVAIGSGTLKTHDRDRIWREWSKETGELEVRRRPKTREEFLVGLAAAGITVEHVNG